MHDDDHPPSSTSSWKSICEFLLGLLLRLSLPSTLSAPKPLTPSWLFLYFLFVLFLPMHFSWHVLVCSFLRPARPFAPHGVF
uniref:Uncharacterized protein n=1 Tax=Triticum urartu TaxID=4572 RepID=A0A8R7V2P6_TRIUA